MIGKATNWWNVINIIDVMRDLAIQECDMGLKRVHHRFYGPPGYLWMVELASNEGRRRAKDKSGQIEFMEFEAMIKSLIGRAPGP